MQPDEQLEASAVVANCRMNRERELTGSNGYARDLRLDPLAFLRERLRPGRVLRWLDLCCGTARALFQAADVLRREGFADAVEVVGVDLVGMFLDTPRPPLRLVVASVRAFEPDGPCDLITCVHGLHYVGDKLRLIERAASWLAEDGLFAANLDRDDVRDEQGRPFARRLGAMLRAAGAEHDPRRRLLTVRGRREVRLPLEYLGADDTGGPNYTGQPSVRSWYQPAG